ncbi:MAG: glycosyltransferase [Bdellovibrionales bacterium]|nr:glycosyltransferase [Bdellovibrionales bacterium]
MMNSKKVIFLFTPGPIGGAEKIVLHGIMALKKEKIDVELWLIKEERVPHVAEAFIELLKFYEIQYRVFSSYKVFDRKLLKTLEQDFLQIAPAIIHAHGFKAAFYGKLSIPTGTKLVVTHHGKTSHTFKVKVYEYIEDQIMKRAAAVIAVSQDMKIQLTQAGIASNKIKVVENFMTSKVIPRSRTDSVPLKLLFVGRLSPEKGCSVLIDAMAKLERGAFKLTVLGQGIEFSNLQKQMQEQNLAGDVTFVGFKQNVNEYMALCDVIVMPSFREGQPLTLIEACCMGIPVVASNVGGIPELVKEENGYLVPANDSFELSQALKRLTLNLASLEKSSEELSHQYKDRFSGQTWANNTISVYKTVCSHL